MKIQSHVLIGVAHGSSTEAPGLSLWIEGGHGHLRGHTGSGAMAGPEPGPRATLFEAWGGVGRAWVFDTIGIGRLTADLEAILASGDPVEVVARQVQNRLREADADRGRFEALMRERAAETPADLYGDVGA